MIRKGYQQAFPYKTLLDKQLEQTYQIGEEMVILINEKRIYTYDAINGMGTTDEPVHM